MRRQSVVVAQRTLRVPQDWTTHTNSIDAYAYQHQWKQVLVHSRHHHHSYSSHLKSWGVQELLRGHLGFTKNEQLRTDYERVVLRGCSHSAASVANAPVNSEFA